MIHLITKNDTSELDVWPKDELWVTNNDGTYGRRWVYEGAGHYTELVDNVS